MIYVKYWLLSSLVCYAIAWIVSLKIKYDIKKRYVFVEKEPKYWKAEFSALFKCFIPIYNIIYMIGWILMSDLMREMRIIYLYDKNYIEKKEVKND